MDAELDCVDCGGAGFFGNGPYVIFCGACNGLGVVVEGSAYRFSTDKKPFGLADSVDGKRGAGVRAEEVG